MPCTGSSERRGLTPRSGERTLWVCCDGPHRIETVSRLVDHLREAYPRFQLALTSRDEGDRRWLADHDPSAIVLAPPLDIVPFPALFLTRHRVQAVLLLASANGLPPHTRAAIRRRRIQVVAVNLGARTAPHAPPCDVRVESTAELAAILRRDPKTQREERGGIIARWVRMAWQSRLGRRVAEWRTQRFDEFSSLRVELGHPETILCLGNGPSSEDPRLREARYDCLFRVNWEWKKRHFLTRADVVFTGSARATREIPSAIFGFQKVATESRILARTFFSRFFSPLRYLTLERLPSFFNEGDWGAKPTNGAAMLAVAVALEPRRLIIAGIDLYADPAGGYPGAPERANAYHPAHDVQTELEIIERALRGFRGEVVILSDALKARLDKRSPKSDPLD